VVVRLVRRKRKASPLDELTPREPVLDALDAVQRVCGTDRTALTGVCAGGIIASVTAAHLAATGQQDQLSAFSLLVTVLDTARAGTVGALVDRRLAPAAKTMSGRRGYLDGRALAEVFAWLRPGDLVWNYWVNNYLLGKKPPAFDVLFWNADTTRMSARLHADFVDLAMDNKLIAPGALTALGTPIDLSQIGADAYIVALVNPPGNQKARYQTNKDNPANPAEWLKTAETEQGRWWPSMLTWLGDRCGPEKPAPSELGGGGLRPLIDAPGTYVFDT